MTWEEILKQNFVDLLGFMKDGANALGKEIPLYVKELITFMYYDALTSVAWWCFITIVFGIGIYFGHKLFKLGLKEKEDGLCVFGSLLILLSSISILIGVYQIKDYTMDAIKCKTAPRVIIVEKLQQFIKSSDNHSR